MTLGESSSLSARAVRRSAAYSRTGSSITSRVSLSGDARRPTMLWAITASMTSRLAPVTVWGGVDRAAAGEGSEERERLALALAEQLVAPVERCPQRTPAVGPIAPARSERGQDAVEPLGNLLRRQRARAGGRKLDRQRQTINSCAHPRNRFCGARSEPEARITRLSPPDEQRARWRNRYRPKLARGRQRQRIQGVALLAVQVERDAAGYQQLHAGRGAE